MSASGLTAVLPARIRARWDRLALQQLCELAARLDVDLAQAKQDLRWAEQNAQTGDHYQALYLEARDQLAEVGAMPCVQPGITQAGEFVVVREIRS